MVSIIIPIYNCEKYLFACLNSILFQTYKDFEVIMIDDGSTDTGPNICHDFERHDKRFKYFKKENGGVSDARNFGIKKASGDIVFFVDSDDVLDKNALFEMMKFYCRDSLVVCNYSKFVDLPPKTPNKISFSVFSNNEYLKQVLLLKKNTYVWGCLIPSSVAQKIEFPKGHIFEDLGTFYKYLFSINKVIYIKSQLYFYRQSDNSYVSSMNSDKLGDYYAMANQMIKDVVGRYENFDRFGEVYMCYVCLQIINNLTEENSLYKECAHFLKRSGVKCLFRSKNIFFNLKMLLYCFFPRLYFSLLRSKKNEKKSRVN